MLNNVGRQNTSFNVEMKYTQNKLPEEILIYYILEQRQESTSTINGALYVQQHSTDVIRLFLKLNS